MTQAAPILRECDGCTLCCKLIGVEELAKPAGVQCPNNSGCGGCGIYETRPPSCRTFHCGYLLAPYLGPEWRPDIAKFLLVSTVDGMLMVAHVDPDYPDAWRREPYQSRLREWARLGLPSRASVVVNIGPRRIQLLPTADLILA